MVCRTRTPVFLVAGTVLLVLLMAIPAAGSQDAPAKVGDETTVSNSTARGVGGVNVARRPDGTYIVTFSTSNYDGEGSDVHMRLFTSEGVQYGGEALVHTNTSETQGLARTAVAVDNSFVVIWTSDHTGFSNVYAQRFDSTAAKVGPVVQVSSDPGILSPQYSARAGDVTYLANGDVVCCWWDSDFAQQRRRVFTRRFTAALVPLSDVEEVHNDATQYQNSPRVASLTGGGFVVVYNLYGRTGDSKNVGLLYASDGTKVGLPFQLETYTTGHQLRPATAALPNGGFIVAWESEGQDGSDYGIVAQHFDAVGGRIGEEIVVNTFTQSDQRSPEVTTFGDNSFAIVWDGAAVTGDRDDREISLQHFDASHNKVGPQILVNNVTSTIQRIPAIAANWVDGGLGVFYASGVVGDVWHYTVASQQFAADVPPSGPLPNGGGGGGPAPGTGPDPAPGPGDGTPAVPVPACISACLQHVCKEGKLFDITVTGVVSNDVWGVLRFTDDSNVASAAVFAGLVTDGETKTMTVKCSGPQDSFSGGSANGITTQRFPFPWSSSFTFDLDGETVAPPPPSAERCFNEPCAGGKCDVQGFSFDVAVVGIVSNNVWGTATFSDDSWVGSAAVHQGLLAAGSAGSVTVSCTGYRESLTGSSQNGVTSNDFGPWRFTYVLSASAAVPPSTFTDTCVDACLEGKCHAPQEIFLRVGGGTHGYLWGGSPYFSDDTTVSSAAVHAGLVAPGAVTVVKATCTGHQSTYTGSTKNGVTTQSFGPYPASFVLSVDAEMPTLVCTAGTQCLKSECAVPGRVYKLSVTGSTHAATEFWGTTRFTDDSPVSHAAVHSGLLLDGEEKVLYATCKGPHDAFPGSAAHGVTSSTWNAYWGASFELSSTLVDPPEPDLAARTKARV